LTAVLSALREKHIMLYFKDPKLNDIGDLLGWSGKQLPGNYDYLMVADANLGNKSNSSIVRQLTYDVTIQPDGSLQSRSTISYDYPSSLADKDPAVQPAQYGNQKDYFNTMQVFLPKGITVTKSDNLQSPLKVVPKDTLTLLVTDTQVAFNASERYQFSYTTPVVVESVGPYKRYRLLIQKQPGTPGDRVSIQITLPPNAQVISSSPTPAASYTLNNPILEFQTQLNVDQWIEVVYK